MAEDEEGRSLFETPTWAVATVVTFMVVIGFLIQHLLKQFGKWLDKTKRKALMAALGKIKEELMLFGVMSLLMGHWIVIVAKICIKSSALSSKFYPCPAPKSSTDLAVHYSISVARYLNESLRVEKETRQHDTCPEGHDSFASKESLEQLHRFLFVLGVTHVSYSFIAIALGMIKIYSWRTWENQAKAMANEALEGSPQQAMTRNVKLRRLSTFIFHNTSHPWSQNKVLVWLLCFSRQFWSSINQADYMALRLGFITTHQLPLSYDFLNYMFRSMEEEFRDIVGISVPLWIYAILCIFLDFHGTNIYFYLSFLPAILILLIGTKLHRVVVKLAVEIMDRCPFVEFHQFRLRDELFWFRRPNFLLRLIQLISFQNAFEMANFIWSLWEIKEPSCFMENRSFLVTRLAFGITAQFWCSYITFPLYVIVTQMGSRFKKTVVTENVRESLSGWHRRVRTRHGRNPSAARLTSTLSMDRISTMRARNSLGVIEMMSLRQHASTGQGETAQLPGHDQKSEVSGSSHHRNDDIDESQ